MVVVVGQLHIVLVGVPWHRLVSQLFETSLVEAITSDDGKEGAELSLQVKQACQAEGEDYFSNHEVLVVGVVVLAVLLPQVPDIEMDEDVQYFSCQNYEN